jgi:NTP pyrophosphatase (non-canonical NTP hydrolase)
MYKRGLSSVKKPTEAEVDILVTAAWGKKSTDHIILKMNEECGEVAGAFVKMKEGRLTEKDLLDELGDLLLASSQLAHRFNLTLEDVMTRRWEHIEVRLLNRIYTVQSNRKPE